MSKKTETEATPTLTIVVMETANWNPKHVKPAALDRESNRQKMLEHVMGFDGKPAEEWLADFTAHPPASIKKGAKTTYTPKQWITWFVKAGVITLEAA